MLLNSALREALLEALPQLAGGLLAESSEAREGGVYQEESAKSYAKVMNTILPFCISSTKATRKEIRTCIQWPIATGTH